MVKILAFLRLTVNFFPLRLKEMLKINLHCFRKLKINFHCFKKLKINLSFYDHDRVFSPLNDRLYYNQSSYEQLVNLKDLL